MNVRLTWYEVRQAALVGVDRYVRALKDGREDAHGLEQKGADGLALHVLGAAGELAFAKATNRFWSGSIDTFSNPDVGAIQVRTRSKHDYELLVRVKDDDEAIYVLVTGQIPEFRVRGWMFGKEAKRKEWALTHGDRPSAFFVPHDEMRAIEDLCPRRLL